MATRRTTAAGKAAGSVPDKASGTESVYLLYGTDGYTVAEEARALVNRLCPPAEQTLGLECIVPAGESAEQVAQALRQTLLAVQTSSFFGGRKVVWLRDARFPGSAKLLRSEAVKIWLDQLTAQIKSGLPTGHILVVSADGADGRTAFFKACAARGATREFELPTGYKAEELARGLAAETARRLGIRLLPDALEELIARTGCETGRIHQELQKLAAYIGEPARPVGVEDVREAVSATREAAAWDLADAAARRELAPALTILRQLFFQKESPIGLVQGLESRWREMGVMRDCLDRGWVRLEGSERWSKAVWREYPEQSLLEELGAGDPRKLHPFRQMKLLEQAAKFSAAELRRGREAILRARERMVSGFSDQEWMLEMLLFQLAARRAAPPRSA